jgi:TRAP-type C4-dicarboxylate transport system permease large subunit
MKFLRKLFKFFKETLKELIVQTLTLVGLFIAWLCMTDQAAVVAGWSIFIGSVVYLAYAGYDNSKED